MCRFQIRFASLRSISENTIFDHTNYLANQSSSRDHIQSFYQISNSSNSSSLQSHLARSIIDSSYTMFDLNNAFVSTMLSSVRQKLKDRVDKVEKQLQTRRIQKQQVKTTTPSSKSRK